MDVPHEMDSYVTRQEDLLHSDKPNFLIQVY